MLELKNKAFELRKNGKSYRSIQRELGVPLSTLSSWFSDQDWSKEIGLKLAKDAELAGAERLARSRKVRGFGNQFSYAKAKQDAEVEYKKLKKSPLFLIGLTLYWAQGNHSSTYYVRVSSSDLQKIIVFKRFIKEFSKESADKLRYSLLITPPLVPKIQVEEWSRKAKIPIQSFTKTTLRRKTRNTNSHPSVVCTATLSSRYLKEKMLVWLRLVASEFGEIDAETETNAGIVLAE